MADSAERGSIRGLTRNKAYWTITLGAAMMTFAIGGLQVWMPTFLVKMRHLDLDRANLIFGGMTVVSGTVATLLGGWLGDRLLRRTPAAYQLVSAIGMALSIPAIMVAVFWKGPAMYPAIFLGEFFLLLKHGATECRASEFGERAHPCDRAGRECLHDSRARRRLLADADRLYFRPHNLEIGLSSMVVAVALSAAVLFYGMRFAPKIGTEQLAISG